MKSRQRFGFDGVCSRHSGPASKGAPGAQQEAAISLIFRACLSLEHCAERAGVCCRACIPLSLPTGMRGLLGRGQGLSCFLTHPLLAKKTLFLQRL